MSDDDPFAEPDDTERTVIRPNPGGRRPSLTPAAAQSTAQTAANPAAAEPPQSAAPSGEMAAGMTGPNPINAAASTLFALVGRVRNRAQHPDPEALRRSVVAEIRAFENRALQSGVDMQHVRVARYALCATIDDVVLNTPWATDSSWSQQSMVATFHRETVGGDRFFDLLGRLEKEPGANIDLLEFMYACMALGFEGRLRVEDGGRDRHADIRLGLQRIIAGQRGATSQDLSPNWQGVQKPHRALSAWKPVWIALGALTVVLMSGFLGLTYALSVKTADITGRLAQLDPPGVASFDRKAPPVAPLPVPQNDNAGLEQVQGFLTGAINAGVVDVFQDVNTITVRLKGNGMFASASDRLNPSYEDPLTQVGKALDSTTGPVVVAGYSDSDPIRTRLYPDNTALSLARAETVRQKLAALINDPGRLKAEGRAARDPIASNATAAGKAQNRRIEIILLREGVTP